MAEIPSHIKKLIQDYINELEINNFPIVKAFLFGSFAKGTNDEWSDIDVALVSPAFEGSRFLDKQKIRKIKAKVSFSISPYPFRPEDFDEINLFGKEILQTGIRID